MKDSSSKRMPRVLLVCEHASSAFGGEAMLPLNYFLLLSKRLPEVFLLTHERTRRNIQSISEINHDCVFYIPDTWAHKFLYRLGRYLPQRIALITTAALAHLITQCYQWWMARSIIRNNVIDIVHEPAPVSPRQPSMMFGLGVPVVIGPMNGGMLFPPSFAFMANKTEHMLYFMARFFSNVYNLIIPGKLLADMLLAANSRTVRALPYFRVGEVQMLVENAVFQSKLVAAPRSVDRQGIVEVLYLGRLVPEKVIDIVIDAVSQCSYKKLKLVVVGDGPERAKLEQYAHKYAPGKVEFIGQVDHERVQEFYDQADIFVLPSVRECGGAVVLEAMARGLPVIATNWGGPADYITKDTGVLVDPVSREYMVQKFSRNIEAFACNPQLRAKIGAAALEHVKANFVWEDKIDRMLEIYCSVLEKYEEAN